VFRILWYTNRSITDTPVYYDYAGRMMRGMLPYRDFASEYPPVAMLLFSLPRLLSGQSYNAFIAWFQAEMFVFSCGIVALISVIAWRQWQNLGKLAGAMAMYTVFLLALGSIVQERFDLAAAFIILASITCFVTDRYLFAWILLGVGLMTKIVPVLIAPVFLVAHYRRRQFPELWMGPVVLALSALIIAIPFLISAPGGLASAFLYHAERPLQIESSWSSPLLLMRMLDHGFPLEILNSYGSLNVFASGSQLLSIISGPVTALFLLGGYALFLRGSRGDETPGWSSGMVVRYAAVAVATFIAGGKVFSPQFLIWLVPLVPLIKGADRRVVTGLFAAVLVLTHVEFPFLYWQLYMQRPAVIMEVALRNAGLAALALAMALNLGSAYRLRMSAALAVPGKREPGRGPMPEECTGGAPGEQLSG
jgi:hypothetical protein